MIGSLRWNVVIGSIGMILTIFFSMNGNVWLTTLLRGLYTFAALFAFGFLIRWFLGTVVGIKQMDHHASSKPNLAEEEGKGKHVDLTTPIEDEPINDSLHPSFTPLDPPKLATKDEMEPEELAKVVRHMSEQ